MISEWLRIVKDEMKRSTVIKNSTKNNTVYSYFINENVVTKDFGIKMFIFLFNAVYSGITFNNQ